MIRVLIPFILFILFMSESIFAQLAGDWFYSDNIYSPKFVLIALIFLAFYGPKNYYLVYSIVFGLLVDIVYSEIIGIYLFSYPIICYLIHAFRKIIQSNYLIIIFMTIFGIALVDCFSFLINTVIKINLMSIEVYAQLRLVPSLIFNFVVILIFMWPLRKMSEKVKISIEK